MPNPNSLFDPSLLNQSFPDAASSGHLDGLDPHREPYEKLALNFRKHQTALGIATLAGVSVDTAASVADLMNKTSYGSLDNLATSFPEARVFAEEVKATHAVMGDMLRATGDVFTLPNLDSKEFAGVDWQRLHEATGAYESLGILSQVVFTPINRPLGTKQDDGTPIEPTGTWRAFYSRLRQWQDNNNPDSAHKLQKLDYGDGLWINDEVSSQWGSVIDTGPNASQWQVSVVPITDKAPVVSIAHDGTAADDSIPPYLRTILDKLPGNQNDPDTGISINPKAETLLTVHATRHFEGKDPIDGKVNGTYYCSWTEGTINNGAYGLAVYWNPDCGQVRLYLRDVGNRGDLLGVRPEVRG